MSTGFSLISRAWYAASIADFLRASSDQILGHLTANCGFSIDPSQRDAWLREIDILQTHIGGLEGGIFFEFTIPRMGRRIDVVLIVGPVVFVLEFKVGVAEFERPGIDQAWDYALDLKNFHEGSHAVAIIPILIATEAEQIPALSLTPDSDLVYRPVSTNVRNLRRIIDCTLGEVSGSPIDNLHWAGAPYHPTPTIVEAARALYARHSVEAIARHDAGAQNLHLTARRLEELADEAKENCRKTICFVTGVPGAGKTLVGLNLATRRRDKDQPTHAVFLSGNGPLVDVLREALTRDEVARRKERGEKVRKGKVGESVKAFIQNVHHFRDDALFHEGPPVEHVVIFDEAQRAWNLQQTANFMQRKKKLPGFAQSEPEFLISCMDRHQDWALVVCLVGGGQEINTGEAGIDAWLDAIDKSFSKWHVCISSRLTDSEYAAGKAIERVAQRANARFDDCLHLAVSMRSFRAEKVSTFVKAMLDCEKQEARALLQTIGNRYPIVLTRDLGRAKEWVRDHARGSERFGMVASSKALRLKPHAIDIRVAIDPVHWFLNPRMDTRSSYYLEDAATEFQVQGLELDWTCVTWDGDLRFNESEWSYHDFRGDRWTNVRNDQNKNYLRNAYRVLLTRARQGMVIFIPRGESTDPTRAPSFYDSTFDYLAELGLPLLF
jgi:hypothetical protein